MICFADDALAIHNSFFKILANLAQLLVVVVQIELEGRHYAYAGCAAAKLPWRHERSKSLK